MGIALNATEAMEAQLPSQPELTDEEVLLRYRETEEPGLFAELVRRYERELYSYLRRFLGSTEMAEDAFQATFLQVHLKCHQFEAGRRVKPWLYAIATNQAIDAGRRNRRHHMVSLDYLGRRGHADEKNVVDPMVSLEPSPVTQASDAERNELLRRALDELSDQMRTVVYLVYYQGLKYREAAEVMSIPVGTVKSRLHTAVGRLAEFWSRNHADLD
jgi:RNA polymerase sigma-70 factor (ECF subfamily)